MSNSGGIGQAPIFAREKERLPERFTQSEVSRIVGVEPGRLRYWQRLRLVAPRARWGERFYDFHDLVALRSIKDITERRIPARKLSLTMDVLRADPGDRSVPIGELRMFASGRQVAVIPPGPAGCAIEPLTGQFLLPFHSADTSEKVRLMDARGAEELFDYATDCEARPGGLDDAARLYGRIIAMRPEWFEPYINLGCIFYQTGKLEEARESFSAALQLAPQNGIAHFNMGCVLDELGKLDEAIEHLERAAEIMPDHADSQFNLASAYEKHGEKQRALHHWIIYLRCQPQGPGADYARTRLEKIRSPKPPPPPIPIRPIN